MIEIKNKDSFTSPKIVDINSLKKKLSDVKGKKVGLCVGGYDLMHPGHILHLKSAKKLVDILIVGITSDKYVSKRKDIGRPIFSEQLRAFSVSQLESVDYVVISDFEMASDLIKQIKPNYYIKGPDFKNKSTPGITEERKAIEFVGGEIQYTSDEKLSTTEIIKHMQKLKTKKILVVADRDGTIIEDTEFLGKNAHWKDEISYKEDVVSLLSFIQTKNDSSIIVVSNQAGVARGYFSSERVKEINTYLNDNLAIKGIKILSWEFCPDVDEKYAELMKGKMELDSAFVKEKTNRKPNCNMVYKAMKDISKKTEDFDYIVVLGDREEDAKLADNLNASFIDVKNKKYEELKKEFESIIS